MKKVVLNYLVIIAILAAFTSCGGSSSSGGSGSKSSEKIKMTMEDEGKFGFGLVGSGVATVDWGDGSEKVSLTLHEVENIEYDGVLFEHTYPNASIRTITITGDNITGLICQRITSLDVSRCTELKQLVCNYTRLTSLVDVSKNTALTYLRCHDFNLTDADMNVLFGMLHGNAGEKVISLATNTGLADIDRSIAEKKGWTFIFGQRQ